MSKPIRIHIAMESKVLAATIRQVFETPGKQEFIDTVAEADAVIFDALYLVSATFDSAKPYACIDGLSHIGYPKEMPSNVVRIHAGNSILQGLIKFLGDNFKPTQAE